MVYIFFETKSATHTETEIVSDAVPDNQQLVKELHKPIIRKLKKAKVHSSFRDSNWSADVADMQLRSKYNKIILFLSNVSYIYNKYACVVSLLLMQFRRI